MKGVSLSIKGERFLFNGQLSYSEIHGTRASAHGLLMNARFIQGIFDDATGRERWARWGHAKFDPDVNTDALIAALPAWHHAGLRAFTVGIQGGGPWYTTDNATIDNNPFGEDGAKLDDAYAARLDRLIRGAADAGMAVIVSYLYGAQARRLRNDSAVRAAVATASRFLRDGGYANVLIEVANEYDVPAFESHPIVLYPKGIAGLIDHARRESGGMPVGCSACGGVAHREVCESSDYVLIHGNGCTRTSYYNLVRRVREWCPRKPIVCNEDSAAISRLEVAFSTGTSWGYYNNMTKQEPPTDWGITAGEDRFFAWRVARGLGIPVDDIPDEEQYYLQGLEPALTVDGKRWPRLACLYPERIDHVDFFVNGEPVYRAYDEPFQVYQTSTFTADPYRVRAGDRIYRAEAHLRDGSVVVREAETPDTSR